jgi:NADH dehydrogenase [ubiquinone] 1 alpha subcomplex assembly factor 3
LQESHQHHLSKSTQFANMASRRPAAYVSKLATINAQGTLQCRRCFHQKLSGRSSTLGRTTAESYHQTRCLHFTSNLNTPSPPPKSKDRGPKSKEETQTDFNTLDVLSSTPAPSTAVDTCLDDGFALNSGLKVTGAGALLVGGEAFKWRPWAMEGRKEGIIGSGATGDDNKGVQSPGGKLRNSKGQFEVPKSAWGVLDLVWPKPDLLVLGTGPTILPVSPATRQHIDELGIRLEVQDTRNGAAQFNLLATERGVQQVVAALVPIGWREGR